MSVSHVYFEYFFFNDTATTEIYTLSLHDALPIFTQREVEVELRVVPLDLEPARDGIAERQLALGRAVEREHHLEQRRPAQAALDRKSTRLNSSHANISYAVFCLKKKNRLKT